MLASAKLHKVIKFLGFHFIFVYILFPERHNVLRNAVLSNFFLKIFRT